MFYLYLPTLAFYDPFETGGNKHAADSFFVGSESFNYSTIDPFKNLITIKKFTNDTCSKTRITFTRNRPSVQIASNKSVITTLTKQPNGRYLKEVTEGTMRKNKNDLPRTMLYDKNDSAKIDDIVEDIQRLTETSADSFNFMNNRFKKELFLAPLRLGSNIANQMYKESMIQGSVSKLYQFVD